eukprot:Opistho-2@74675
MCSQQRREEPPQTVFASEGHYFQHFPKACDTTALHLPTTTHILIHIYFFFRIGAAYELAAAADMSWGDWYSARVGSTYRPAFASLCTLAIPFLEFTAFAGT